MRVRVHTERNGRAHVVDAESGKALSGVTSVTLRADVKNLRPVAVVEILMVEVDAEADAVFKAINPTTGLIEQIKRIEFADGSVFEA